MNIVSNYPHVPLNLANPPTQLAERDNQRRELITQTAQSDAYPRERAAAQEGEGFRQRELPRQRINQEQQTRTGEATEESASNGILSGEDEVQQANADQSQQQQREEAQAEEREQQEIQKLSARDQEVRTHEQAHASVGGQYAGSPSYEYERGPDGRSYAVSGEVPIDASKVAGDPQATIDKMNQVRAAALAPAEPSGQDRKVAAEASATAAEARRELALESTNFEPTGERAEASEAEAQPVIDNQLPEIGTVSLAMQQRNKVIAGVYHSSSLPAQVSGFRASA